MSKIISRITAKQGPNFYGPTSQQFPIFVGVFQHEDRKTPVMVTCGIFTSEANARDWAALAVELQ